MKCVKSAKDWPSRSWFLEPLTAQMQACVFGNTLETAISLVGMAADAGISCCHT